MGLEGLPRLDRGVVVGRRLPGVPRLMLLGQSAGRVPTGDRQRRLFLMALFLSRYLRKRQRGQDAIHRAPVARFHHCGGFQPALVVKVWVVGQFELACVMKLLTQGFHDQTDQTIRGSIRKKRPI